MEDTFVGRWKLDVTSLTGVEEYVTVIPGFNTTADDLRRETEVELVRDGQKWTVVTKAEGKPEKTESYVLGEPLTRESKGGVKIENVSFFEGDILKSTSKFGDQEFVTTRRIQDGAMVFEVTSMGKTMTGKMHRA